MKRKRIIAAVMLLSCFLLGGCEKVRGEDIKILDEDGYTAAYIEMNTKYKLKGYDKEYIENGCIVHIYYETKGALRKCVKYYSEEKETITANGLMAITPTDQPLYA